MVPQSPNIPKWKSLSPSCNPAGKNVPTPLLQLNPISHRRFLFFKERSMTTEAKHAASETSPTASCEPTGCIRYYLNLSTSPVIKRKYLGSHVLHICTQNFVITLDLSFISPGSVTGTQLNEHQKGQDSGKILKHSYIKSCLFFLNFSPKLFKNLMDAEEVIRLW